MTATSTSSETLPTSSSVPTPESPPMSPVISFIIGLAIILAASILNAGGLNITKLDHVRTRALPKASQKRDYLRPLWLLGMLLYILSQLIGSTLALEYMRAEFVAPLGSSSLVFNFLFASVLVGTPVTKNDIYGTVTVIFGVIGIVAFGSVNSGLSTEINVDRLHMLWSRGGWLTYFLLLGCIPITAVYIFATQLEDVLTFRGDVSAVPFAGSSSGRRGPPARGVVAKMSAAYFSFLSWVREKIEKWAESKDDKALAWTLGLVWACCGGGLAGGCLVFAKVCVKLISGSLSHKVDNDQFAHPATIVTFIFLSLTAVFQIICLNRGLKAYDSTLVVPVFYGIYTASGFLNSLIFNDEVDAYQTWTLFLIFLSILILIFGVVLLTNKKPHVDPPSSSTGPGSVPIGSVPVRTRPYRNGKDGHSNDEEIGLRENGEQQEEVMWAVGDDSDGEDETVQGVVSPLISPQRDKVHGEEGMGLINTEEPDDEELLLSQNQRHNSRHGL